VEKLFFRGIRPPPDPRLATALLHDQRKSAIFWRAGFFPVNQGFLKTFQIVLIGWIKAGPPKKATFVFIM